MRYQVYTLNRNRFALVWQHYPFGDSWPTLQQDSSGPGEKTERKRND